MFCSRKMNRKINHIHERALRLVYEDYASTFKELLIKDRTVSIHHKNIQYVAIEMYKVMNDLSPPIMKEIFKTAGVSSNRSGRMFSRPKVNSVYKGQNSLRNVGPIVWNMMLPEKFKSCTKLSDFQKSIKAWVPQNCPCRLCKPFIQGLGFASTKSPSL